MLQWWGFEVNIGRLQIDDHKGEGERNCGERLILSALDKLPALNS
jgi:hypothetical protein